MHRSFVVRLVVAVVAALVGGLLAAVPASAATGTLTLTITGSTGTLRSADVSIYARDAGPDASPVKSEYDIAGPTYTTSLPAGRYSIRVAGTGHETTWVGGARTFADAEVVVVGSTAVKRSVVLDPLPRVRGTVRDQDGRPVAYPTVVLYELRNGSWESLDSAHRYCAPDGPDGCSYADGTYELPASPGTYRVRFAADGFTDAFLGGAPTVEESQDVVVDGADVTGIDGVLNQLATVRGQVVDERTGKPIASAAVQSLRRDGDAWSSASSGSADAQGRFVLQGDAGTTVRIRLEAGTYRTRFVGGASTVESAEDVTFPSAGATTDLGTVGLQRLPAITGRAVDENGDPVSGFMTWRRLTGSEPGPRAYRTYSDGRFAIYDEPGSYRVSAYHFNYVTTFWTASGGTPDQTKAGTVVLDEDGTDIGVIRLPFERGAPTTKVVQGPSVVGTAAVGRTLTVRPGTYKPTPSAAGRTYQWFANGKAVTNGTGTTLTLVTGLRGKRITVRERARSQDFRPRLATSKATKPVAGRAIKVTRAPSIAGTATVGRTLTVRPPAAWPSAVTISYRWYADGKAIKAATRSRYKVSSGVRGKRITVRATLRASGFDPRTVTSGRTRAVTR